MPTPERNLSRRDHASRPAEGPNSSGRGHKRRTPQHELDLGYSPSCSTIDLATAIDEKDIWQTDSERSASYCSSSVFRSGSEGLCRASPTVQIFLSPANSPSAFEPGQWPSSDSTGVELGSLFDDEPERPPKRRQTPGEIESDLSRDHDVYLAQLQRESIQGVEPPRQMDSAVQFLSQPRPRPTFACPYFKRNAAHYNPQNDDVQLARRFRTCAGPGWESTHRLKEHLTRAHVDELTLELREQLKRKSRGSTEEERWMLIYKVCRL